MKYLLVALVMVFLQTTFAGTVGNVIKCTGSMNGTYAVDYLRMAKEAPELAPHIQFGIQSGILQYLGFYGLSISASHFFSSSKPNTDFDTYNVWQEAAFGFNPIPLDKTKLSLPPECQPENNQLLPVLVLENNSNNRIISFDPNLYMTLKDQDLLQAQLLVSRLWLSEFTDDDDLIFKINQLWYRKGLLKEPQSLEHLKKLFQQLLLSVKRNDSVCERSQYILRAFQRVLRKNCDQITATDLASIIEIDIQDKDRKLISFDEYELRKVDLAGLTQLKKIVAHDIYWFGISLLEGFFANAPQLQHLDLKDVTLDKLRRQQLPVAHSLLSLSIDDTSLSEIQAGAFENVFSKDSTADTRMVLSRGFLEHFDSTQIIGLENLKQLYLKDMLVRGVLDLSKLKALEELDLQGSRDFTGVLRAADHPHLKKLVLSSTMTRNFKVEGPWPQLESLDASMYIASHFPPAIWFHGFLNLKSLNISYNSLTVPNGQSAADSGFSKLGHLEYVSFMDTNFISDQNNGLDGQDAYLVKLIGEELPPNVKILEVCLQSWRGQNLEIVRGIMKKQMIKRPELKVRTKNDCLNGEWIDVTL